MTRTINARTFRKLCNRQEAARLTDGEWAWAVLLELRPDLAMKLIASAADPYRDDSRLPLFWAKVEELW